MTKKPTAQDLGIPTCEVEVECGRYCQGGRPAFYETQYPEHTDCEDVWVRGDIVYAEIERLRSEVKATQADAERYRWLKARRVFKSNPKMDGMHEWHPVAVRLAGNTLDEAIDTAMGEQK